MPESLCADSRGWQARAASAPTEGREGYRWPLEVEPALTQMSASTKRHLAAADSIRCPWEPTLSVLPLTPKHATPQSWESAGPAV